MSACNTIIGVPAVCEDNNQGGIKRVLIAAFEDVEGYTDQSTPTPDTAGNITAITMASGTTFQEFVFKKDVSSLAQAHVVDLGADTHGWSQTIVIGLRRISLRKRNAISILAKSRRDLVAIAQDWNGDYWLCGRHQGMRLTANEANTNEARTAGQQMPFTLTAEYEPEMMYKVDSSIIEDLLP